ncbi:MAG TPA: lmo0937 family membrane protein [Chthonomonadaceae bacterium]|nr:lmo0937 family membrane protein [Chthonomonadaceae bacterium]
MAGILWAIVAVLVVLWLLGWLVWHVGAIIHILIVAAVILFLWNLFTGNRTYAA